MTRVVGSYVKSAVWQVVRFGGAAALSAGAFHGTKWLFNPAAARLPEKLANVAKMLPDQFEWYVVTGTFGLTILATQSHNTDPQLKEIKDELAALKSEVQQPAAAPDPRLGQLMAKIDALAAVKGIAGGKGKTGVAIHNEVARSNAELTTKVVQIRAFLNQIDLKLSNRDRTWRSQWIQIQQGLDGIDEGLKGLKRRVDRIQPDVLADRHAIKQTKQSASSTKRLSLSTGRTRSPRKKNP